MQLVVTEKPSVAQAISHVIGAKERKDGYMEGNGFSRISKTLEKRTKSSYFHAYGIVL